MEGLLSTGHTPSSSHTYHPPKSPKGSTEIAELCANTDILNLPNLSNLQNLPNLLNLSNIPRLNLKNLLNILFSPKNQIGSCTSMCWCSDLFLFCRLVYISMSTYFSEGQCVLFTTKVSAMGFHSQGLRVAVSWGEDCNIKTFLVCISIYHRCSFLPMGNHSTDGKSGKGSQGPG